MNFKERSKQRELSIAKDINGTVHPGSGSVWYRKGDVSNDYLFIEDKFTIHSKYSVQLSIIDKATTQAHKVGRVPILRFGFEGGTKHLSFAVIENKYLTDDIHNRVYQQQYETDKRSYLFKEDLLYSYYIDKKHELMLLKLIFTQDVKREFYIFEWDQFIESMNYLFEGQDESIS